nr:alpha-1,4 glucan phosphorylase L isozyme, chloroplastic/amyloplastic [Ipomoea batatas]
MKCMCFYTLEHDMWKYVGATINHDLEIGDLLMVVFVPDYIVSVVELLIPASELSQHISTCLNGGKWNQQYEICREWLHLN